MQISQKRKEEKGTKRGLLKGEKKNCNLIRDQLRKVNETRDKRISIKRNNISGRINEISGSGLKPDFTAS